MKKIILSLILCLMLGFGCFGFSACKKDAGYSLSNLENDYKAIVDGCRSVVYAETSNTDKGLVFDYSGFVNANGQHYLEDAINNQNAPYSYLKDYNKILNNMMMFVNGNIHTVSTDNFAVAKNLRNEIKTKIENLGKAFERVDIQVQDFARNINTNSGRDNPQELLTDGLYLQTFKHLLDSYDFLYEAAFDTTITLAKIYYSINDGFQTTDMSTVNLEELSEGQKEEFVTSFVDGLQGRSRLAIAGYSYVFYRQNMQSGELSQRLITKPFGDMTTAYDTYSENVTKISKNSVGVNTNNAAKLRELSIELFNIWSTMANDYEKFYAAYRAIDINLQKDEFALTDFEKSCFETMDNFFYLIEQDVNTLIQVYNYI